MQVYEVLRSRIIRSLPKLISEMITIGAVEKTGSRSLRRLLDTQVERDSGLADASHERTAYLEIEVPDIPEGSGGGQSEALRRDSDGFTFGLCEGVDGGHGLGCIR